jgi:hypothetical protein
MQESSFGQPSGERHAECLFSQIHCQSRVHRPADYCAEGDLRSAEDQHSTSPKELYEVLLKRYLDPATGTAKSKYGEYRQPVSFSKYFDPHTFNEPLFCINLLDNL